MNNCHIHRLLRFILVLILIAACKRLPSDQSITVTRSGADEILTINFKEIKDSVRINLNDFAGNFQLIPLETKPECFIKYANCLISNKYIICDAGQSGFLQFDRAGKFIRKLVSYGKGPMEVLTASQRAVDESSQTLILSTSGKPNYFPSFNLVSGEYDKNIPNAIPSYTRNLAINKSGEILCVPYKKPEPGEPSCLLYQQTQDGVLTGKISGPENVVIKNGSTLYPYQDEFRFSLVESDTLYSVRNFRLVPWLVYNYGEVNPIGSDQEGFKRTRMVYESNKYAFMNLFKITKVDKTANGFTSAGAVTWICLDKIRKKASLMKEIFNDFTGTPIQSQEIQGQPGGLLAIAYQAADLLEIAERTLTNPNSPPELRKRMEKIAADFHPDDNPVLLVGRLK